MPRLFVGVPATEPLEVQPVLDAIEDQGNLKPVDQDKLHVTLAFIGDVQEDRVPACRQAVREGAKGHPAQRGTATGLGAFPSPRRASVLWAGIQGATLTPLAEAVRGQLGEAGLPYDDRGFHAHLTLARLRNKANLAPLIHEHETTPFGPFPVQHVHLYASTLTPEGPIYETLERVPLEEAP